MKIVFATLFVLIVASVSWTWFWTIPHCLESGVGTPASAGTARSVSDDEGVFGCWWARLTRERRREEASKDGRVKASAWIGNVVVVQSVGKFHTDSPSR